MADYDFVCCARAAGMDPRSARRLYAARLEEVVGHETARHQLDAEITGCGTTPILLLNDVSELSESRRCLARVSSSFNCVIGVAAIRKLRWYALLNWNLSAGKVKTGYRDSVP